MLPGTHHWKWFHQIVSPWISSVFFPVWIFVFLPFWMLRDLEAPCQLAIVTTCLLQLLIIIQLFLLPLWLTAHLQGSQIANCKISYRFLQDFLHISPKFPTDFSKISYIFLQDFLHISPRFLQDFLHISPDFSKISGPPSCRFLYHKVCVRAQRIEWCQSPSWMWSLMNRWQSAVLCLAALIIRRERNKSGFHLSSPPQCQAFEQTRKKRHTCLLWVLIQLFQNTDRLLIQTWLSQRQARELKEIHCKAFFQKKPQWTCSHKLVKEDGWCYCVV